ncbi:MAG: LysE family translocator [Leptolyngbyaceae bacterium]|nr:LysE family translocator [Leptolyngbyaceae bacterium]
MELLTFTLISLGFIMIPGPNVLVILSTSIAHGIRRGIQTAVGINLAMIIQLCIAAVGTTWFVATLTQGLIWLKWMGVAYLLYLGVTQLFFTLSSKSPEKQITALGSFQRGFWVSLTNPKTILFFSAFLPQFAVQSASYFSQIILLSFIFWAIAAVVNCSYVVLSSRLSSLVKSKHLPKVQSGVSGVLYVGAGAALATAKTGQ